MEIGKNLLFVFLISILVPPTRADGVCSQGRTAWNPSAPARFGLSLSLRKTDRVRQQGCGMVSQEALQIYVVAQWVCEKLNADLGNGSFVPGVQFGFDLLDDCRSPTRAVQYALDYVDLYSDCESQDNSTTELRLGLVGPTRSSTTEETADSMRSLPMPIISPSATLASLTEGDTPHPNFFRTAPSDKLQIKAIVSILKTLRWTFVAVVYTDDNYGVEGSRMLKEEAMRNNICVNASIPIRSGASMDWVVSQLLSARQRAEGESMAVVYIGEKDKAENLIFNVWSLRAYGLHFIMSDSVSTNVEVFDSGNLPTGSNIALGSLTMAPSSVVLEEFQTFLNNRYNDVKDGRVQDDVIRAYLDENGLLKSSDRLEPVKQISFVPLAVSAIFALAEATRQAHRDRCSGAAGVCPDLVAGVQSGDILDRLRDLQVDFGTMNSSVAPREFQEAGYVLEFDVNGDVVAKPEWPDYTVFAYDDADPNQPFLNVGTYSGGGLTLDMTSVRMLTKTGQVTSELPTSVCDGYCVQCADDGKIPLAHVNGSAYLIGVFSMHERNADQPFKCGDFRNVSFDAVVLEAFLHAMEHYKQETGIDFGAVAFDDCYSPLHITSVLSDFLSGLVPFDKGLFDVCVTQDKVVGMVGSLSSDSTLAVASFCTSQRVPTISYAASSPDLDDPINYPYFLRTVPSDEEQAIAMTELIKEMGWEYVGLLYVSNNYGTKGAQAFKRVANERGVCVASPVSISVDPTNVDEKHLYDAFVTLMQQSVKVVVFFGIDTRMADFLRLIESRNEQGSLVFIASEEWGNKNDVLDAGRKAARGSITFKVDNTYIDPAVEESLRRRLLEKTPSPEDVNPWFSEFWQHVFDCNIPGGFNNIFASNCQQNQRLSAQQVDTMMSDQRVKHVMNAVQAMTMGLAAARTQICEDSFPCPFLRSDKYAKEVFDSIKSQTVTVGSIKEQLFDQNGNGNIGFSIYNIQKQGNGYVYTPVGSYSRRNGLSLTKDSLRFYTDTGLALEQVDASCSDDLCSAPECVVSTLDVQTPEPEVTTDKEFRVADMVILILLVVVCLLLLCCLCVGFKYFRQKVRSLSKELHETKNEPIYHVVQTPRQPTYGNVDASNRAMSLPLPAAPPRIQFVNGMNSASNSPGNTLDGRTNPAFISSDTTINGTPTNSETSISPAHHRHSPPSPPNPNPQPQPRHSPAPAFHHSVSAGPRLQHSDATNDSENASSQHNYYMTHSMSSNRQLPALPGAEGGGGEPRARALQYAQHGGTGQSSGEDIPLQNMSPGSHGREDPRYLHATDLAQGVGSYPQSSADDSSIQYFRMTPSGQLEEREEEGEDVEEDTVTLKTYSLSSREEERPALNTYSLSPQMPRAPQQHPTPGQGPPVHERSESLPPLQDSAASPPLDWYPHTDFVPPLRITPEMREMLLQQLLMESALAQQGYAATADGAVHFPQNASLSSVGSSSQSSAPSRPPRNLQGYRQQMSYPTSSSHSSSTDTFGQPAKPRHSYPQAAGDQARLTPPIGADARPASSGFVQGGPSQSMQTGIYAPISRLPQYSAAQVFETPPPLAGQVSGLPQVSAGQASEQPQVPTAQVSGLPQYTAVQQAAPLPGLPQTSLSSPYAQLAQTSQGAAHEHREANQSDGQDPVSTLRAPEPGATTSAEATQQQLQETPSQQLFHEHRQPQVVQPQQPQLQPLQYHHQQQQQHAQQQYQQSQFAQPQQAVNQSHEAEDSSVLTSYGLALNITRV